MQSGLRYLFLSFILVFLAASVQGQSGSLEITGTVVESSSGSPIGYATVVALDPASGDVLAGTATAENGTFRLKTKTSEVEVEVRFLGFEDMRIKEVTANKGRADLGNIKLVQTGELIDEVEIRAEKSNTVFKLEKRIFNVGQDLSNSGASALEVLNNVPSVNVSIEGEISLRGNRGVQILINGKPSVLASEEGNALGTITADMIDRVEVITNPSAKYEAEGTAGILNIVLKKDERKGANGSISVNTGWPHNHSLGFSVNRRTEKFNLFSQAGAGYRSLPRFRDNANRDLLAGTAITSDGVEYRNEIFMNFMLGADYHINRYNVLTLSGSFAYEIEDQPSETNFQQTDANGDVIAAWQRTEITEATNPKWQYEMNYKKEFKDNKEHTLVMSAIGNFFGKAQTSDFQDIYSLGAVDANFQRTATDFGESRFTFKGDYTQPFNEYWTLEAGSQYFLQDVSNDFQTLDSIEGQGYVADPGLTNLFEFDQKVLGVYTTGAYEKGRWGAKLGLRMENTDVKTFLVNTQEENDRNYTNWFPTVHTSYKITERYSLQAGYSRRIFRPRLWHLNPFFNIRNQFNIRAGNPNLQPEFTDSYELNSIYVLDKASLNLGVFHVLTTNNIEHVSFPEDPTGDGIVNVTRPVNIGTRRATGLEFNFKYSPHKKLTFNGDVNYQFFTRNGNLDTLVFDFSATQWSTKLTGKVNLPKGIDLEMTGNYNSPFVTVQGRTSGTAFMDLGLRKKFIKGKAVVSLSVRDVFFSRIDETLIQQGNFEIYSFAQRGRYIRLGFSYGFGKGEAMEYSGRRRR